VHLNSVINHKNEKHMKKLLIIALITMAGSHLFAQGALGDIVGEVVDFNSEDPVYAAEVFIESNGSKYRTRTDFDGRFRISGISAGTHIVNIQYKGDTLAKGVVAVVPMDGIENLGQIKFTSSILELESVTAKADDGRMKLEFGSLPVKEITSEDIVKSSAKFDIKGLITSISSEVQLTNDGELVFRGARKGDMLYLMDGVKTATIGNVPSASIARMKIYSGGLPAKYGDTMGGVVVMESKSYFDLYNAWYAEEIKAGRQ